MQDQNFKNHARLVLEFHVLLLGILAVLLVLSIINLFHGINLSSVMFFLIAVSSILGFVKIRTFPLTVQDRVIRAEENLRHFTLTGKLLDNRLTLPQIIALRFASNEEFVELAEKAIKENLSNRQIKQAIQNWKADHHRA
ncbi:MAG TPA: DUF6526 family protein [Puia sp.]|jgi:hypothetical protein|nr:DUF6526 family protein [Puia sp.]